MLTEEEAVIGTIVANASQPRKRQDHIAKLREQTDALVRGVREGLSGDEYTEREEYLRRACLAYRLATTFTRDRDREFGARSFGWIALGAVFEAVGLVERTRKEETTRKRHE
jgi:RNA-dependent RNA polymerase